MKKLSFLLVLIFLMSMVCVAFVGCVNPNDGDDDDTPQLIDYVSQLKFDKTTTSAKLEVQRIENFIDGDTTHFKVNSSEIPDGILKARYLAIDTPECTSKREEYGKAAAAFTRSKLESADSIWVESDTDKWTPDSTGSRYTSWVWYRVKGQSEYRNLNLEILQNGLAMASNTANNRYGEICQAALMQAQSAKLKLYSGEKDPEFFYGDAVVTDLKAIRLDLNGYKDVKVCVEGIVTNHGGETCYIEMYDEETDMYYGMPCYYGFKPSPYALEAMAIGTKIRMVGMVEYYEAGKSWQISGLEFKQLASPTDTNYSRPLSTGHSASYRITTPATLFSQKTVIVNDENKTFLYADLALGTTVTVENLEVVDVYTTTKETSSSQGAITITCKAGGVEIDIRTEVLQHADGSTVLEDEFIGKTITVKGLVEFFSYQGSESYQVKVLQYSDITFVD